MANNPTPTIGELFPRLTEQELKEAEENLERYLVIVLRIFERVEAQQSTGGALTPNIGTLPCTRPRSESSSPSS